MQPPTEPFIHTMQPHMHLSMHLMPFTGSFYSANELSVTDTLANSFRLVCTNLHQEIE